MTVISIYLLINMLFVALLAKRQRVLAYVAFGELFLLSLVWIFTVNITADFASRIVGESAYVAINDVFVAAFGDAYIAPSMLLLMQIGIAVIMSYLVFRTVRYVAEKLSSRRIERLVTDDERTKRFVTSIDLTKTKKIFILNCRFNN